MLWRRKHCTPMANPVFQIPCFLLLGFWIVLGSQSGVSGAVRKEYIVYMGDKLEDESSALSLHKSMIEQIVGSDASQYIGHSYKRSFNGFSVKLTEEEMKEMAKTDGIVSVFPSQTKMLHTTRSWDFIGFPQQVKRSPLESDVIIGVLDSGIWPESESFSDEGFGPPPSKWKGSCQTSSNFSCNNKIIGAKYYKAGGFKPVDLQSPRDSAGHGTHTASTAAGNVVSKASLMGLGLGTARGGVPSARIAVYKVCWPPGLQCSDANILAAFDDAIDDGVDILSLSLGGTSQNYFEDSIAIGAFHAMKRGILTSSSAGNEGPAPLTLGNVAPWLLSVAASTIDRKFFTLVKLGNKEIYSGVSVNAFERVSSPLIYAGDAPNTQAGFNRSISRFCVNNSLDRTKVKGKIVLCDGLSLGEAELMAGAAGSVVQGKSFEDVGLPVPLPQTHVGLQEGRNISRYTALTSKPTATILKSIERKDSLAPYVASFSSRGPNPISPSILKPDIAAPGVTILAAWTPIGPITDLPEDKRAVLYNIISGTSMACPHVTAIAAYIKSYYPTWSPAAIQSALMTTAIPMNPAINRDAEFAYGSGHINPSKALNPGLVYDAGEVDYVKFLCLEGYNATILKLFTRGKISRCQFPKGTVRDLNYPSFAFFTLPSKPKISHTFYRTLTNVGSPASTYKATVSAPSGFRIQVLPNVLSFKHLGQKLSFSVKIKGVLSQASALVSASLIWDDGVYQVRSPIIAYTMFES